MRGETVASVIGSASMSARRRRRPCAGTALHDADHAVPPARGVRYAPLRKCEGLSAGGLSKPSSGRPCRSRRNVRSRRGIRRCGRPVHRKPRVHERPTPTLASLDDAALARGQRAGSGAARRSASRPARARMHRRSRVLRPARLVAAVVCAPGINGPGYYCSRSPAIFGDTRRGHRDGGRRSAYLGRAAPRGSKTCSPSARSPATISAARNGSYTGYADWPPLRPSGACSPRPSCRCASTVVLPFVDASPIGYYDPRRSERFAQRLRDEGFERGRAGVPPIRRLAVRRPC